METTVIPEQHEIQVQVQLSKMEGGSMEDFTGIVEPELKFSQRYSLLVARSISTRKGGCTIVRLLNPTTTLITVHQLEKVGSFHPVEIAAVHTLDVPGQKHLISKSTPAEVDAAIAKMMSGIEDLTEAEIEQLTALLASYVDIISTSDADIGRTDKLQHVINTDGPPVKQAPRRLPFNRHQEVREMVDKMLQHEIIEPAHGPWSSPIVLVKKKDGSTRFCVDFRRLNSITRKDAHPLPRIDDTLDALSGASWFSILDLASGYWQVELAESDREKTAFSTPYGLFQFRVMPFGLCNAPSTFQRLMELVLTGVQWSSCLVYIDDIIIFSSTVQGHFQRLVEVFERLRSAGLEVKPSKCHLFRRSVDYLGHIVSKQGIQTDPGKTENVTNWHAPNNVKELRQFLGLASYYRRFVKNFALIAAPLHRLTEKAKAWSWTPEYEQAFNALKERLTTAPILAFPQFDLEFTVDCDTSSEGLGAVLSQAHNGKEYVISYASRTLSKAERRYCATRKEMLALVWAVRQFRPYLYGKKFTVRTDHNTLK
jgi:hypothetical protein